MKKNNNGLSEPTTRAQRQWRIVYKMKYVFTVPVVNRK